MAAVQRARRTKDAFWYWECPSCKGAHPGRSPPDCACPGPGTVYLGRTFESPELVFVRSLEVDA